MIGDDFAKEVAELLDLAHASEARSLQRLVDLVTRSVPSCCGATSTLWHGEEVLGTAATHPDLAALAALQFETGSGPLQVARQTGRMASCADTLNEPRWPEYAAAALRRGVRSSATLMHDFPPFAVTLSLYGVRPNALDTDQLPLATLLTAFGGATLANATRYDDAQRTASQLQQAVESRAVVDQAKGILMHALGLTAEQAFDRLREISQKRHLKLSDVARKVVEEHSARSTG